MMSSASMRMRNPHRPLVFWLSGIKGALFSGDEAPSDIMKGESFM